MITCMHTKSECATCLDFASCGQRDVVRLQPSSDLVSELVEDYVLLIHQLGGSNGNIRPGELASRLGVNVGSVTRALQRLSRDGYVEVERSRSVCLTKKGQRLASDVEYRRDTVVRFLTSFGVSPCIANRDATGLKHFVGPETLRVLVTLFTERESFKSRMACSHRCFCPTGTCAVPNSQP
jgi:DtxR family manganese transport transcriptional regulator